MSHPLSLILLRAGAAEADEADEAAATATDRVLRLPNDADLAAHVVELATATRVELHFPKFTDGRAFSQAVLLRQRLGWTGPLRATGDVLIDQLAMMARTGFSEAVLRADQDLAAAQRLLAHYPAWYQGDVSRAPHFAGSAA